MFKKNLIWRTIHFWPRVSLLKAVLQVAKFLMLGRIFPIFIKITPTSSKVVDVGANLPNLLRLPVTRKKVRKIQNRRIRPLIGASLHKLSLAFHKSNFSSLKWINVSNNKFNALIFMKEMHQLFLARMKMRGAPFYRTLKLIKIHRVIKP